MPTTTTIDQTYSLGCPTNWSAAAERLGVSRKSLAESRNILELVNAPLNPDTFEKLRVLTEFIGRRNSGGGARCTRLEFVRLTLNGGLPRRLAELGIYTTHEAL